MENIDLILAESGKKEVNKQKSLFQLTYQFI